MIKQTITLLAITLTMGSCGLYNKFSTPEVENKQLAGESIAMPDTAVVPLPSWQEVFTDAKLQTLINQALTANSDLRIASLNISQAERMLRTARLSFLPSFMLKPEASISSGSTAVGYTVPLHASWEIDIFGKLRNSKEQALAAVEQSKEYEQMVQTQLVAAVASNYYALLFADKQLDITRQSYTTMAESYEAIKSLKEVGMQTEAAVAQASASLNNLELSVKDLEQNIVITQNNLCLLLNQSPKQIERSNLDDVNINNVLEQNISLAALSNRPDVRVAEMELSKSFYGVSYARSALYPTIGVSGVTAIANAGTFLWSALANATQPLFMAGANRANLQNAKDAYEQQLISFEKALIQAGKEVNDAVITCQTAEQKRTVSNQQVETLSRAVEITKALMTSGQANYLEVLTAQNTYLASRINQAGITYTQTISKINLYKALGGGRK